MKKLLPLLVLFFASPLAAQFSLPWSKPIACSGPANNCAYPPLTNGYTAIIVARLAGQPITVYGQTVKPDFTGTFTGDSIYHFAFTSLPSTSGINVTFPPGTAPDAFLLLYEGIWQYDKGASGDYARQNSAFPDCINGQDCAYWWTTPIVPEKGELLVAFGNSNATGCGAFRPGPGWTIEATGCIFAVEDKIATVEAPDIGSMYSSMLNGNDTGGTHWLMGLAAYRKLP